MARRKQSVTIRHVAADAGVSLQTVSRVINREAKVHIDTERRVRESIERLGYVPSVAAQRMAGSKSRLILTLNDRERTVAGWRLREGTDWFDQMMLGGMLTAARFGYRFMVELTDSREAAMERELRATLVALQPDGAILTPPHSEDQVIIDLLVEHGVSIARVGSISDGPGSALTMDDRHAARLATDHLLSLGHRRIGFIAGPPSYALSGWRIEGWREGMAAAKLPTAGLFAEGDFSLASGEIGARQLLAQPDRPTAIIASSDQMTMGALATAKAQGLIVPDDLSLVSFDDTPIMRFTQPPLTAVVQPIAAVIARAVELIVAEREGAVAGSAPVVIPADLAVRESSAPPPSPPLRAVG